MFKIYHPTKTNRYLGLNGERTWVCECKHFTDGQDCEKCLPFYNDAPWGRATSKNVHECKRKWYQHVSILYHFECVSIVNRNQGWMPSHFYIPMHTSLLALSLCNDENVREFERKNRRRTSVYSQTRKLTFLVEKYHITDLFPFLSIHGYT